ncbi:MAG: glycosyltransferase [Trueperaceae bacterium]
MREHDSVGPSRAPGHDRRVLFASITVGNGHLVAAEAGAAWLRTLVPEGVGVDVLDFIRAVGDLELDRRHKASWRWMLRHPWSAYYGQRLLDEVVPPAWTRAVQGRMLRAHAKRAAAWLQRHPYRLVVCTHFFTAHALVIARRRHGLRVPIVTLSPDAFDAHVLWAQPEVDAFAVYSAAAARDLIRRGVPEQRVRVLPPVLRPAFQESCDRATHTAARARLGLPADAFVALWSAGGEGVAGPLERVLARLRTAGTMEPPAPRELAIVVLCGRNEELRERLAAADEELPGIRVIPLGFRDDVRELLCAADLSVGKAGPATTFEALISGRPVLFTDYAAANERALVDHVVAEEAGRLERRPDRIADLLQRWRASDDELDRLREAVRALGVRNGGPEFARWLLATFPSVAEEQVPTDPDGRT